MRQRSLALLSVFAMASLSTVSARAAGPREAMLITPAALAQQLKAPDLVILQLGLQTTYDAGHIPGAQFVNLQSDGFAAPRAAGGLALELPSAQALHDRLVTLGVTDRSRIVIVYSDQWYSPSTRLILTLNYAGLGGRTVMLEGGMSAWKKAGLPVTTDAPVVVPGTLAALKTEMVIVDAEYVKAIATTPTVKLIDARDGQFYDGVMEHDNRAEVKQYGHIPGAANLTFSNVFNEAESLRPAAELEALFAKAGVKPGDTIVGYCHIGQQATAMIFAARTLGYTALLYDGSMDDWTRRALPLVKK